MVLFISEYSAINSNKNKNKIKNMNWGKGIILGLAAFMTFVIVLVVMMFKSSDDSYDKDYYEKGLNYDKVYEQKKNVLDDKAAPAVHINAEFIVIDFLELESGKVEFFRPSDNRLDKTFQVNGKQLKLPLSELAKGEWKLIAEWSSKGKSYLYEKNVFIE